MTSQDISTDQAFAEFMRQSYETAVTEALELCPPSTIPQGILLPFPNRSAQCWDDLSDPPRRAVRRPVPARPTWTMLWALFAAGVLSGLALGTVIW